MLWKTYRNWMLTYNGTCKNPKRLNSGLFSQPRVQRERETHVIVQTAPSCLNIPSITPSTCSDRPHPRPQLIRVVLSSLTEAGTKQHLLNQWHSFCCSWLIKMRLARSGIPPGLWPTRLSFQMVLFLSAEVCTAVFFPYSCTWAGVHLYFRRLKNYSD